jgi:uncharacterized protein YjiS (DUF1127 family)
MNAPMAKDQLAFELPKLSYIDASLEEPNLRAPTYHGRTRRGPGAWLAACVAALAEWRRRDQDLAELQAMTDRDLADIGLNRGDLLRVFTPEYNKDLLTARGHYA